MLVPDPSFGMSRCPQAGPSADAKVPSVLVPATQLAPYPAFRKEKKYNPDFEPQKSSVTASSSASEDGGVPSRIHSVTPASSISHFTLAKQFALKSLSPSCLSPQLQVGAKDQVVEKTLVHGTEIPRHRKDYDIRSSQFSSVLKSLQSDHFTFLENKGRHDVPLTSRCKHWNGKPNVSNQLSWQCFNSGKLRKIESNGALSARMNKRPRLLLTPTPSLDNEFGEVCEFTHDLRARFPQDSIVPRPLATQKIVTGKAKTRRKRTRSEFEASSSTLIDFGGFLGPDIRTARPLPKKANSKCLVPDEDAAVQGDPCGALPLEHGDQLLRHVGSNGVVVLQERVEPDVSDWIQNKEQDAEGDDLDGHDEDAANNDQITIANSPPVTVTVKPSLLVPPRIWAQSRQEVCESFDHFRSYHSGVYSKDDIVKGYLLGAYAASRDMFHHGGKLIISHGGGKSQSILERRRGPRSYQTDQDQEASDKSVRALVKTYKDRRPLVLLADDKYALFPYDLASGNYTYVVLGLYWISHAWAECQPARDGSGRIVRWKFAFQWCEGQGDPWWASEREIAHVVPKPSESISDMCLTGGSSDLANIGGDSGAECERCQQHSPFIYKQGWMCLNPLCDVFWTIKEEEPEQLEYREEFLSLLPQTFESLPSLTPTRVVEMSGGVTTTITFSKGWHCMKCGRLSCRYKWEHWECSNCGLKHVVNGRIRSPKEFWHQRPHKEFLYSRIGKDSGIVACCIEPIDLGTPRGFTNRLTFILPYDRGKIHLILGTPLSNEDADNIFQLYQQQASTGELKLRRYPLRNHRARGQLLTNYFSQNSGEPYQYVGGTGNTVPFHDAPDCVRRALAVIKERSSLALCTDVPFNEVLSAAYMERQKMSFHSDSEKGLGPVVASLSLGSAALMHFRPHVAADCPKSKVTCALTLALRHGDVLIMEGDGVQKHYEHTVIPMNFRIAATARCIEPACNTRL